MTSLSEKLERWAAWTAIAAMPIGARKIFWNASTPATEWNAVFVSLTDILIVLWAFVFLLNKRAGNSFFQGRSIYLCLAVLFAALVAVSAVGAGSFVSLFKLYKLAVFLLFAFLVSDFVRREGSKRLIYIFVIAALFQALLGVTQFFLQHDLGLQILGESPLGAKAAGVAKFDVGGAKVIRAYGTLPHPNILAAYIAAAVFFVFSMAMNRFSSGGLPRKDALICGFLLVVLMFGLIVTFSRGIFAGFAAGIFLSAALVKQRPSFAPTSLFWKLGAAILVASSVIGLALLPLIRERLQISQDPAISIRALYMETAFSMIRERPLVGVGWGRFTDLLPEYVTPKPMAVPSVSFPLWLMQPVHNIYLLVAAEAGVAALAVFASFVFVIIRAGILTRDSYGLGAAAAFFMLIIAGLFDHFPLTVQQGALLFWFLAGILMAGQRGETYGEKRPISVSAV